MQCDFVVEPYYPEWCRGTMMYRVARHGGGVLILSDAHSTPESAWQWLDDHRYQQGEG